MANDFWNNLVALTRRTLARAEAVNSILSAIKAGFDLLPSKARLYEERVSYGVDSGVANAYIVAIPYAFTLSDGARICFKALATNSGASVIDVRPTGLAALGNIPIVDQGGNALGGGEIMGDVFTELRYNTITAKFHIVNPNVSIGTVTVNNLAKVTGADTTPGTIDGKISPVGAIARRVVSAGSDERYQLKLRETQAVPITANTTIVVGSFNSIDTSSAAIAALAAPAIGSGDTALQDGDFFVVRDVGGALETNSCTINFGTKSCRFMDQGTDTTLVMNDNFVEIWCVWDSSADLWIATAIWKA